VPIEVACTACRGHFNAPDNAAGKTARCPTCGGTILIPQRVVTHEIVDAEPAPAQAAEGDFTAESPTDLPNEARRPCPMCGEMIAKDAVKCRFCGEVFDARMAGVLAGTGGFRDPGWKKVRSGLYTMYYSFVVMVLTVVLLFVGGMVMGAMGGMIGGKGDDIPVGLIILITIGGLVILGAAIAMIIGEVLCTNVPPQSGAKNYIIGSIVCVAANFALAMVAGATQNQSISAAGNFLSIVGHVLLILFIRATAIYLGNTDLARSASRFLIFAVCAVFGGFVVGIVAILLHTPLALVFLALAAVVAGLVSFVWYLRLIKALADTIDQRLGTRSAIAAG